MELSDKKVWIYGLLIACPEGIPLQDCPLEKYRKLSCKDRLSALDNFTEGEVEKIINHHNHCLFSRV